MDDTRLAKMIDRHSFTRLYWDELNAKETTTETFDRLNTEYKEATGVYRYFNYDSFRRANLAKGRRKLYNSPRK